MRTTRESYWLDLFTTALEGGIGYWSLCTKYHWSHSDGSEDYEGFYAKIIETEAPVYVDGVPHQIDRDVILRGYQRAATDWRDRLCWSTEPPPLVINGDTDWDFDAGDADMIVQLGLFGDVRYG